MPILRLCLSDKLIRDLKRLQEKIPGVSSLEGTIRRVVAQSILLHDELDKCKSATIEGRNPNGKDIKVKM